MSDAAARRRRRDAVIAGHRGDVATAGRLCADPAPEVRAAALGALDRCGALEDRRLVEAAADPSVVVRRRVAELAGGHAWSDTTPGSDRVLVGLLDDGDTSVAEMAAWASGERRPTEPRAVERLVAMATDHAEPLCREAAVAALGAIGDPRGLAAILHGLDDRATIRRRAVLALAPFDGPEVDEALRRCLDDRDWQVRHAAEDLA